MTPDVGTPAIGVHAAVEVPPGERSPSIGLGPELTGGVTLLGPLAAEAQLAGAWTLGGTLGGRGALGLRLHTARPYDTNAALSVFLGAGGTTRAGLLGEGVAELAADLPTRASLTPRLGLEGRYAPADGTAAFVVTLGGVYSPHARPAPVVAPAPPPVVISDAVPPATPSLAVPAAPAGTLVWLAHPVCEWVPLDVAAQAIAALPPPVDLTVYAPGFLPAPMAVSGPAVLTLQPAPRQGHLVIVAAPGDRVEVDGAPVALGEDGVALVRHRVGDATVSVRGGGREAERGVDVEAAYATWVRFGAPAPWAVNFDQGSAVIGAAARAELQRRVGLLGDARLRIVGSYSEEGDASTNLALARERAEAVRAWLAAHGVGPARVEVGEPAPPASGLPADAQRAAYIQVLAPVAP